MTPTKGARLDPTIHLARRDPGHDFIKSRLARVGNTLNSSQRHKFTLQLQLDIEFCAFCGTFGHWAKSASIIQTLPLGWKMENGKTPNKKKKGGKNGPGKHWHCLVFRTRCRFLFAISQCQFIRTAVGDRNLNVRAAGLVTIFLFVDFVCLRSFGDLLASNGKPW